MFNDDQLTDSSCIVLNTTPNGEDDQTNVSNKALAEEDDYVSRGRRRNARRH